MCFCVYILYEIIAGRLFLACRIIVKVDGEFILPCIQEVYLLECKAIGVVGVSIDARVSDAYFPFLRNQTTLCFIFYIFCLSLLHILLLYFFFRLAVLPI